MQKNTFDEIQHFRDKNHSTHEREKGISLSGNPAAKVRDSEGGRRPRPGTAPGCPALPAGSAPALARAVGPEEERKGTRTEKEVKPSLCTD